jgi:phage terminase large subunit-like protein
MVSNKRALDVIQFVQMLKLTGDFFGQYFQLLPWQVDVLTSVYGTLDQKGKRQYKTAYLEIPKKNGKTTLVAALALYHLVCDPSGGQILCAAAERKQASLVFNAAKDMVAQSKPLSKVIKIRDSTKEMVHVKKHSTMSVLSAEAYSKHGLNPSVVIVDELHAHQKRDLWDTLTFGSGSSREEQLIWCITTAGDDPDKKTVGWEQHEYARRIRDGEITDPTWYVKIYGVPETADIFNEEEWFKANPSLGSTINLNAVRQEALQAQNSESAEKLFRWLRCNQWVQLKRTGWMPLTLWDATVGKWSRPGLFGRDCYVGIDLSTTTDLTALAVLFPPAAKGEDWKFFFETFIPADNMREREKRDHVPFERWVREKHLNATPGDVVDYAFIASKLEWIASQYKVKWFCADKWRIEYLRHLLPEKLRNMFLEVSQSMAGMSGGMNELERLFRAGEISHEDDPLGRWTFGNVAVATDGNENIKPRKDKSVDRIDPVCALIDAMAAAVKEYKPSVYEVRGLRSL